jgi:uncharacterized membrane protein (DUF485 family)
VADRTVSVYESGEADRLPAHDHEVYGAIAQDSGFVELRRRYRGFAFPATFAFMVWYITYVICASWARDFMATKMFGQINVAIVFGLLQFLSTFVIACLYARHASRSLDPPATKLHEEFDRETGR